MLTLPYRHSLRGLVALLVLGALLGAFAQGVKPLATVPQLGTVLRDPLQISTIRTMPQMPIVGAWGLVLGSPTISKEGVGIDIQKVGQAIAYPTIGLLAAPQGTIEFVVACPDNLDANNPKARVLLDSWAITGSARLRLTLQGNRLALAETDDRNQTRNAERNINWGAKSRHRINLCWDATDMTVYVDGGVTASIDKPSLPGREPLGIALGNSIDLQNPALLSINSLRLSTARESAPSAMVGAQEPLTAEEMTLRRSQANERRFFPFFERLRQMNVGEVPFAYALAYADNGDLDRAMQSITPITNSPTNPLYVKAIFLRADFLSQRQDYVGAYEQLQVLTASPDQAIRAGAQVKQAQILYDSGQKGEAKRLISEVIAGNPNLKQINDALILIGIDNFKEGNFSSALVAFDSIFNPDAPPRETVPIGVPFPVKVSDPSRNVQTSDAGLLVTVSASSGDKKELLLKPAFSRGMYIGNLETVLGKPDPTDTKLHVHGHDRITIKYTDSLTKTERTSAVGLATDAKLMAISESGTAVYHEIGEYQKLNIIDDDWNLVGSLPKKASSFFRDSHDGTLFRRGYRFDKTFFSNIKAGQGVYIELNDPDLDISDNKDTGVVQIATRTGAKMDVTVTETEEHSGIFTAVVKTVPQGQPKTGMLEVGKNDTITVSYHDPDPAADTSDPNHTAIMVIRTFDGRISVTREIPDPTQDDPDHAITMAVYRVNGDADAKDNIVNVTVEDRDLDTTDDPDKVTVKLHGDSGTDLPVTLTETGNHTGIFTCKVKITTVDGGGGDMPVFKGKPGERITASYVDDENSTGQAVERAYVFRVNIAENAVVKFFRQNVEKPKTTTAASGAPLSFGPPIQPKVTWEETTILVPNTIYRVDVMDGDVFPTVPGQFYSKITLKSDNGAFVDVPTLGKAGNYALDKTGTLVETPTTFSGMFFVRLGDKDSPTHAYFSQMNGDVSSISTTSMINVKDEEEDTTNLWSIPAINVQGRDKVSAIYLEPLTADGKKNQPATTALHVAGTAELTALSLKGTPLDIIKPGMPFELQISDPKGDISAKRDTIKATITTSANEKLDVELNETDVHSGLFSVMMKTAFGTTPAVRTAPGNENLIAVPFGGKITVAYHDVETSLGAAADPTLELATNNTADAEGTLVSKVFEDQKFEVETLVRLGESLYAVGAAELAMTKPVEGATPTNAKLKESARLLQSVIDRFPTSDFVVESLFLTGKIRREEKNYAEADKLFSRVIEEYPDSEFVPEALYQQVLLFYDQDNIDKATEAAMHLVYGFPKNPMVADAVLRIAEYYYNKKKDYLTAAFIYSRLVERFPDNPKVDLISYRMATAYYRAGLAGDPAGLPNAVRYYMEFSDKYKDHELAPDSLYWAANAYNKMKNTRRAYTLLTRLLITYPNAEITQYGKKLRDTIKEANPNISEEDF